MKKHTRGALAVTTAIGLVFSASFASAQEADVEAGEIIVTAQKRTENLQDVPISISVLSGENLQQSGAVQLVDFGAYTPGLQVDSTGTPGQSTISLRGVAPVGPSQTVGTYLDDAPVGSSSLYARSAVFALDLLPYDIQRIEILRGPQGTLYGASSIGGLLKYVTVTPSLDGFSGKVGGEVFTIDHANDVGYAVQGMVNAALVPGKLGISASYAYRDTPGYVDNIQTGKKDQNGYWQEGARVSLLWQPDEALSVRLSGMWQTIDADGNANVVEDLVTDERIGDGLSNWNYLDEKFRKKIQYYASTIDYDFDFATLTSATTYSRMKTLQIQDASRLYGTLFPLFGLPEPGLSPFTLRLNLKKWTQEVRLTSPSSGNFEWMVGGFYTYENSDNKQLANSYFMDGTSIPGLDPLAVAELPSKYREYAVFGNVTYRFSDAFDITGGLRWARNKQRFRQISEGAIIPTANDPGRSSESVLTYSLSPQFHVNDDTMLYARVASGYRPGGPNVTLPGVEPTVGSDSLVNYEVGLKSILFDRTLTLDLAAFYMDWKDIQLSVDFNGVSGLANAGSARSQGLEASLQWRPVPGLALGATGAYTDAKLTSDTPPSVGGFDGDRLPRIPKWSGSLTADYTFNIDETASLRIGGGLRHTGRRLSAVESDPNAVWAKSYTALDLNAALTLDESITIRAYARNVTDKQAAITRDMLTDGLGIPYAIGVTPLQPRTIGVALDLSF